MGELVEFPDDKPPLLIGPFSVNHVLVEGRVIPLLTGNQVGDQIELIVDGRFGATFPEGLARDVAWLIAQAMAVASGYSHLGAETKDQPFAAEVKGLS